MIQVYYFDGSGGCERCKAATGHSFPPPERPHIRCDCPITEDDIVLDDFEFQYRNPEVLESYVTWSAQHIWENCFEFDRTITFEFGGMEENEIPAPLEQMARDNGWAPPEVEDEDWEINFEAHHRPTATVIYDRYIADMSADVYIVGTIGEETFEAQIEQLSGHYELMVRIAEIELDVESC